MEANKMKILSGTRSNFFSLCSEYLRSLGFFVWLVGLVLFIVCMRLPLRIVLLTHSQAWPCWLWVYCH